MPRTHLRAVSNKPQPPAAPHFYPLIEAPSRLVQQTRAKSTLVVRLVVIVHWKASRFIKSASGCPMFKHYRSHP